MGNRKFPARRDFRIGEEIFQPFGFGLGLTDDEHLLSRAGFIQFFADTVDVAAEALHRFDLESAGRFQGAGRYRRSGDGRKMKRLAEHAGNVVQLGRAVEPFEIMPPLLFEFHRFDQQKPALRREIVGEMGAIVNSRREDRQFDFDKRAKASLAGNLEPPQRFDPVTEKLHPRRIVPIRREYVHDPAANGELAGQFHRRQILESVFHEPAGKILDAEFLAGAQRPRLPCNSLPVGDRLQ